jgi:molybdopterin biosynthesis enzyme MoaB
MSLFNEAIESIAQAIVIINRALKYGVIEEENYKGLREYLNKRAKDFKLKKSHIAKAKQELDEELQAEVEEFFMEKGDALYKWAEELLEEYEKDIVKDDDELLRAEETEAVDWQKQSDACKAWAVMTQEQRAEMAVLASEWQKSRA